MDKLIEDANQRLKNKEKLAEKGKDTPFASVYKDWNKTLRTKSAQQRNKSRARPRINTNSSYWSENSQIQSVDSSAK